MDRYRRFETAEKYFACPHCGGPLSMRERSLVCQAGHCFDIAKEGYVNLAPQVKQSKVYSKETFAGRRIVLESGCYGHVLEAVCEAAGEILEAVTGPVILDAGCGEGYYSRNLSERITGAELLAFDISKESVKLAAKADRGCAVKWFVGDLAHIPVRDSAADVVLDIFSPANYREFGRVLAQGGHIVKVVPGPDHLKEFRAAAKDLLRNADHSNDDVIRLFEENCDLIRRERVKKRMPMAPEAVRAFAEMTPLLFSVNKNDIDLGSVTELTIDAEILVGVRKTRG